MKKLNLSADDAFEVYSVMDLDFSEATVSQFVQAMNEAQEFLEYEKQQEI